MEWIKVKAEHISPLYTNAQVGALIRYQLLVAQYGRLPERKELTKYINSNCLVSLERTMSTLGVTLEYIGSKVLEDRQSIESRRRVSRATSKRHYDKHSNTDTSEQVSPDTTDKRREDKSIVDKKETIKKDKFGEYKNVLLTEDEYLKLQTNLGIDLAMKCIEKLSSYKESSGKKYKSDYATFSSWVIERVKKDEKVFTKKTKGDINNDKHNAFIAKIEAAERNNESPMLELQ